MRRIVPRMTPSLLMIFKKAGIAGHRRAQAMPCRSSRGYARRDDGDMAVAGEMRRYFREPADVLGAILWREAEIAVEAGAQRVAIEQDGRAATREQPALQCARNGRLAGARQAREPDHRTVVP